MLFVIYCSGKHLALSGKVFSKAGLIAMLAYTLNEGLRYGRGLDYNYYGQDYEVLESNGESIQNIGFLVFEKICIVVGLPWQGCVMFMSFLFIVGLLFLLREYGKALPIALPWFVLISLFFVENMVKWYFAFSVFMIALAFMIRGGCKWLRKYIVISLIACLIHYAFLPIPILFYIVYKWKKGVFSPMYSIPLFFVIGLAFQTSFMLRFADLANIITVLSENYEHYGNDIDYWLTSGNDGSSKPSFPGITEIFTICLLLLYGYKMVPKLGKPFVFAYNLFAIGVLLLPVANQIELVGRYIILFYHFMAIVFASIFIGKKKIPYIVPLVAFFMMFMSMGRRNLTEPLFDNAQKYLYIWNSQGRTYDSMINVWKSAGDK
jgi:hypothetical protein